MKLSEILQGLEGLKAKGDLETEISNITHDSNQVTKGSLFIAIKGFVTDGHAYLEDAIKKGAAAVIVEAGFDLKRVKFPKDVTLVISENTRYATSICAINFYKNPSKHFKLIGITGTKGKTTTAHMIKAILEKSGKTVGLIGTMGKFIGAESLGESKNTTPDSVELQETFAKMKEKKADVVVMEVSSQSLKLDRVSGLQFDIGVFTNFAHDHISEQEHPTRDDYFSSKLKLLQTSKVVYMNEDDIVTNKIKKQCKDIEIHTYGIDNSAELIAKDITVMAEKVDFKVKLDTKNEIVKVAIPGRFSVYNALAAICIAKKFGVSVEDIKSALETIRIDGRSELVENSKGITIMIDYAHTPESLENILKTLKCYVKGKVISIFGCRSNKDQMKRPMMGEVAGKIADFTIITSDNPKKEDPEKLMNDIEAGMKKVSTKYTCIVDRREAIQYAIKMAKRNDAIIITGRGHEPNIEIGDKILPFSDRQIIESFIK